jgi:membrane peptidoglycan carboxypeptidase
LVHAVVSHEDGAFFRHSGFAPWAIRDALVRDLEAGRYVTGASTISMQLAKNLFLRREKTLARKAQEVILTWWLEAARSKAQILELYLNLIEYGPGIYGIRAAANHYFGREPVDLSAAEAVFLASILPAPKRFHAEYVAGELTRSMAARMRRQLARLADRGQLDQVALADGLAEIEQFRFARPGVPVPHVAAGGAAPLGWSTEADEPDDLGDDTADPDYAQDFDSEP